MGNVLVIGEFVNDGIDDLTREALGCALKVADPRTDRVLLVLFGTRDDEARTAASEAGIDVVLVRGVNAGRYSADAFIDAVIKISAEYNPSVICLPGSSRGTDLAPALAVVLDAVFIPSVVRIEMRESAMIYTRLYWHGKLEMDLRAPAERTVLTCQPGSFSPCKIDGDYVGKVHAVAVEEGQGRVEPVGLIPVSAAEEADLRDAEVIVSAGRGIGSLDNCRLIQEMADLFPRSAVGSSRPLCDYGWFPYGRQIGQTGKKVSPRLYIACGISGSAQHVAGMKGSEHIVAINSDPDAPIFRFAQAGIIDDCADFIRAFVELVSTRKPV